MKKSILTTIVTLIGAVGLFAQGQVFFSNLPNTLTEPPERQVFLPGGSPVADANYVAELWFDTGSGYQIATPAAGNTFAAFLPTLPGYWTAGVRNLSGTAADQTVDLKVVAWDHSAFATYGDAVAGGGISGESVPFSFTTKASGTPPNQLGMTSFVGFSLAVPEPSTIALGVLGLGALVMFRRRKN